MKHNLSFHTYVIMLAKFHPLFSLTCKSMQVCREWEAAALEVNKDVRLALIRTGVVLGKDGGALGITNSWLIILMTLKFLIRTFKFSSSF